MSRRKSVRQLFAWLVALLMGLASFEPALAATDGSRSPLEEPEPKQLVRLIVPSSDLVERLVQSGVDLAENIQFTDEGITVDAVVSGAEMAELEGMGIAITDSLSAEFTGMLWRQSMQERQAVLQQQASVLASADQLTVARADYIVHEGLPFLSVEARTSAGSSASVTLKAAWDAGPGTEPGDGGEASMSRFVDAGQYMYHRMLVPITDRPGRVKVTSSQGGEAIGYVSDWLHPVDPPKSHYVSDFIDHYMTPTEAYARIEALAAEFPKLAEIIELPYKTNGYRRKAQATLGSAPSTAVVVTSKAWGHEGGNDISIQFVKPSGANQPLSVQVNGNATVVNLATDASSAVTSRAIDVVNALNASAADLITAMSYRGNAGTGVVEALGPTMLSDFLHAPVEVSREPFTVKAIRIGKSRDGSKPGVFAYSQEHAREWVTPLVTLEAAERLLRNYAHDAETKQLVDNLDIFILPSVNPDGGHYSFYDYNLQRKNMLDYCGPTEADPGNRNAWGVDINRNYEVGSLFDGYAGGSSACRGQTYSGPAEVSEPESQNVVWLASTFKNIKFSLNVHSYGGYFMWAPGAYKNAGRQTLPRPDFRDEAFFWQMADNILSEIKGYRGVNVVPGRTGATADVLYSAAGNSADHLWYDLGIYAINFEVGAQLWNAGTNRWVDVGFQPAFSEGHEEGMEYANGLIALLKLARAYDKDHQRPKSELLPGEGTYQGPVAVEFVTNEPATVYYTTDGSRPTLASPKLHSRGLRESTGETLPVTETTTFKWFSVDAAGNVEHNYDPGGKGENYNTATIQIRP